MQATQMFFYQLSTRRLVLVALAVLALLLVVAFVAFGIHALPAWSAAHAAHLQFAGNVPGTYTRP